MSALIKCSGLELAAGSVRRFGAQEPALAVSPSEESLLEARVAELELALTEQERRVPTQLDEARLEGGREALKQRSDAEERAIRALTAALKKAKEAWLERLGSWEAASAGIAREVLAQVFGASDNRAVLVEAALAQRLKILETESVVLIRVSSDDFPTTAALTAGAVGGTQIEVNPNLRSGECVINLKLGSIDLSLGSQWQRVAELLDRIELQELSS